MDVRKTIKDYAALMERAAEILKAGHVRFDGINSVELDDGLKTAVIGYWTGHCGECDNMFEWVPVEMLEDGTDLDAAWKKEYERREEAAKKRNAVFEAQRLEAERIMLEETRRKELAELARLKAKYPDA